MRGLSAFPTGPRVGTARATARRFAVCGTRDQRRTQLQQRQEKPLSSRNQKKISLGDEFGDVMLKINRATVEIHADGSVAVYSDKRVDVHRAPARKRNLDEDYVKPEPGERMPGGGMYIV